MTVYDILVTTIIKFIKFKFSNHFY